jgi:glutamine amidotransferase
MSRIKVSVIDYGMGNVCSVISAIEYLGAKVELISNPEEIVKSNILIIPGVGSYNKGMRALKDRGIDEAIVDSVINKGNKILGICLGMQLMGSHGTENGDMKGLNFISNKVTNFSTEELNGKKIPHVGFNTVSFNEGTGFFEGLPQESDFYFTHSHRMLLDDLNSTHAICKYGVDFLAAFQVGNIFGTQFHPEKSQTNGLVLLKNFLKSE